MSDSEKDIAEAVAERDRPFQDYGQPPRERESERQKR